MALRAVPQTGMDELVMHERSHSGSMMRDASEAAQEREAAAVRATVASIHERERTAAQNEKSGESFEERRARIARERANANMTAARGGR